MKLYLAPLEGITGYIFRNTYEKHYGHIDKYFAPFIAPADKCPINPKEKKDILPENNEGFYLVPQILTCKSNHFIESLSELEALGYKEVNLNLGCPSGTVCSKGKGAGFLPDTDKLKSFLDDIYDYGTSKNIAISLKTRLGFYNPDEFYDLMEIFNKFPVSELIVHPRIRGDFYKGEPRTEYYEYALKNSKVPLVYNGNVFAKSDYDNLCKKFGQELDSVMIGRGVLHNPSLPDELLSGSKDFDYNTFWEFHDTIYHEYQKIMSPDINVLYKMKELWTYWRVQFDGKDKVIKQLLKTKKYPEYEECLLRLKG